MTMTIEENKEFMGKMHDMMAEVIIKGKKDTQEFIKNVFDVEKPKKDTG